MREASASSALVTSLGAARSHSARNSNGTAEQRASTAPPSPQREWLS